MLLLLDVRDHADWRSRRGYKCFAFFGFLTALLVGRTLAHCNLVEGAPLRFHPHMGIARKHGARDVASDAHDHPLSAVTRRASRPVGAVSWQRPTTFALSPPW